jgi:hypothetical protein
VTGTLDPRIAWQRAVIGADELPRSTRGIALTVGANLSYDGAISVGVEQLADLSGYSVATVRRALHGLRAGGWLEQVRRGYRGRTSTYQAAQPGLLRAGEYRSPMSASPEKYRSPVSSIDPDNRSPMSASPANSAHLVSGFFYENEDDRSRSRPTPPGQYAAQGPLLAAVRSPEADAVLADLPAQLVPRTGRDEARLRTLIGQRLSAGWTTEQLVELAGTIGAVEVRDGPALFAAHVPARPPRARVVPARPAWCGACHEGTRLVEHDDGRVSKCRDCHPNLAAVAL